MKLRGFRVRTDRRGFISSCGFNSGLCAAGLWLTAFGANAAVLHVPSADYPTIQSALDATVDGDVVQVAAGVFSGPDNRNLDFNGTNVTLRGAGMGMTILDAEFESRVIYLRNGETAATVIERLTITGGVSGSEGAGGGLRIEDAAATIREVEFVGNTVAGDKANGNSGGGAFIRASEPMSISDCEFRDNSASRASGGGLRALGDVTVERALFIGNRATANANGNGGFVGGAIGGSSYVDCQFIDNYAESAPGGLAGASLVEDCVFIANWAGGVLLSEDAVLRGSTVVQNGYHGVVVSAGNPTIENCVLWENCNRDIGTARSGAFINVRCSIVGTYGDNVVASEDIVYRTDPLFCLPGECIEVDGDFSVEFHSRALPENNECNVQIGAYGWGCGDPTAIVGVSWGKLKSQFGGR